MVSSCVCVHARDEKLFLCGAMRSKRAQKITVSDTKGPQHTKKFVKKKKTSNDGQRGALARCDDDSARDVETVAILESRANCEW